MIIQTISTKYQFRNAFEACGRGNQFSRDALNMLFDYLDDQVDVYELDPVGLCCEFVEMDADEVREQYDIDADADIVDFLTNNTLYIGETAEGFYVFASF
mgnify:CR=1 FL=1